MKTIRRMGTLVIRAFCEFSDSGSFASGEDDLDSSVLGLFGGGSMTLAFFDFACCFLISSCRTSYVSLRITMMSSGACLLGVFDILRRMSRQGKCRTNWVGLKAKSGMI